MQPEPRRQPVELQRPASQLGKHTNLHRAQQRLRRLEPGTNLHNPLRRRSSLCHHYRLGAHLISSIWPAASLPAPSRKVKQLNKSKTPFTNPAAIKGGFTESNADVIPLIPLTANFGRNFSPIFKRIFRNAVSVCRPIELLTRQVNCQGSLKCHSERAQRVEETPHLAMPEQPQPHSRQPD